MKKTLLFLTFPALVFSGCNDHDHDHQHCTTIHKYQGNGSSKDTAYCQYIPADTANVMINSYLGSLDPNENDLHSLDYNADSLRAYINNPNVVGVKFMFAHTTSYINSGGKDKYAGYQSGALTFVIAGYDAQGNYVFYYYPQSQCAMVKDHCEPCPVHCPGQGTASSDTLVVSPTGGKK